MQVCQISSEVLKKWADSLYAIGKSIPDSKLAHDLLGLARMIYKHVETKSAIVDVQLASLEKWKAEIDRIFANSIPQDKLIVEEILRVKQSIEGHVLDRLGGFESVKLSRSMPELLGRSILLSFTLWYGGQSFSISKKEIDSELGLQENSHLRHAYEELLRGSVFSERRTGLIVLNPRFKVDVDMATLFLIALGANLTSQANSRKGYSTIQRGFLDFSRNRHHPMTYLAENARSYISDFCQRVFSNLFNALKGEDSRSDYTLLRRFLARLSLYSSSDFVISNQPEMKSLVDKLENSQIVILKPFTRGDFFIMIRKELMRN